MLMQRLALICLTFGILPLSAQEAPKEFNPGAVAIPADSKSPYDFRGKPDFAYPPYEALYQAKTVAELAGKLEAFFKAWKKDGRDFKDPVAAERYFRCKQALIRLYYLQGHMQEGDRLMVEFHPTRQDLKAEVGKLLQAAGEKEKIDRAAERIRVLFSESGEKLDPYPKGPPKDLHEVYEPILEVMEQLPE